MIMRFSRPVFFLGLAAVALFMLGCPSPKETVPTRVTGDSGNFVFEAAQPITDTGIIDNPCIVADPRLRTMHLTYLYNDMGSQRIQYIRFDNGEIASSSLLSEQEGTKAGGGRLAMLPGRVVAYWINIKATGGQLRYRIKPDSDANFTRPAKWNQRNEARWPVILDVTDQTHAYFFIHPRNDWELVGNYDFSEEDEPTLDVPQGSPFHLQGVTDSRGLVCLAYFERESNNDYGRIAFLKSKNGGESFLRKYLFDDLRITNLTSFFRMERSVSGGDKTIHVIYTEEHPDLTTLYYSRSEDGGENFTIPVAMFTSEYTLARSPLLLAEENSVFIATADAAGEGPALRYVYSSDGGNSFSSPEVAVSGVASPETISGVMGDDGSVVLVWDDIAADMTEGEQLYMMKGHPSR